MTNPWRDGHSEDELAKAHLPLIRAWAETAKPPLALTTSDEYSLAHGIKRATEERIKVLVEKGWVVYVDHLPSQALTIWRAHLSKQKPEGT